MPTFCVSCVCMCARVCIQVFFQGHTGQSLALHMVTHKPPTLGCLDCLLDLGSLIRLGWPADEALTPACFYHPSRKFPIMCHHAQLSVCAFSRLDSGRQGYGIRTLAIDSSSQSLHQVLNSKILFLYSPQINNIVTWCSFFLLRIIKFFIDILLFSTCIDIGRNQVNCYKASVFTIDKALWLARKWYLWVLSSL